MRANKKFGFSNHVLKEALYHDKNAPFLIKSNLTDFIWIVQEKIIFIKKYVKKGEKWCWLDIGCGPAENIKRNILPLMSDQNIYVGVDVSQNLLNKARENIFKGIFIKKPMGNLELPYGIFDYVSFFGALHHDEFYKETLMKISSFLKKGGYLFLREPTDIAMKRGYGLSPCEAGINPEELKMLLKENNFKIIEWHFLNTKIFHFIRKILNKIKLRRLEEVEFFWKIKVCFELFLEKFLENNNFTSIRGTDMFIVAKKLK
jgi:SAM-dependent methyltransferase